MLLLAPPDFRRFRCYRFAEAHDVYGAHFLMMICAFAEFVVYKCPHAASLMAVDGRYASLRVDFQRYGPTLPRSPAAAPPPTRFRGRAVFAEPVSLSGA